MNPPQLLLPCPFCGEPPVFDKLGRGRHNKWHVGCINNECHAGPGLVAPSRPVAARRWNTRAPLSAASRPEGT